MTHDERFTQDAISQLEPVEPSARLQRMVAQIPLEHPRNERVIWPFGNLWVPSFSLAAAAALGLYVGQLQVGPGATSSSGRATAAATTEAKEDPSPVLEANEELTTTETDTTGSEDLDTLLLLATAADFEPTDWDLSQRPTSEESEQVYQ